MSKFENLTGQTFGRLVVIRRAFDYISPKGQHKIQWLCRCSCGKEIIALKHSLTSGKTKSCGCLQKERTVKAKKEHCSPINLTGQKFGRLTVIEETYYQRPSGVIKAWICKCDCGNISHVTTSSLLRGKSQSCGCLRREKQIHDLTGRQFGRLTVISLANENDFYYHKNSGNRIAVWKCQCECGNKVMIRGDFLTAGTTRSCGCLKKESVINNLRK